MKYCAAFPAALVLGVLAGCGGSGSSLPTTDFSSQIAGTNNPQVASYSITVPKQATVNIEYSRDTGYALKTWEVDTPEAGGKVSILVAGMLPNATYHMRAVVAYKDGTTVADTDHTFQSGGIPPQVTARYRNGGRDRNQHSYISGHRPEGKYHLDLPIQGRGSRSGNIFTNPASGIPANRER
jgi:hypothetical protein